MNDPCARNAVCRDWWRQIKKVVSFGGVMIGLAFMFAACGGGGGGTPPQGQRQEEGRRIEMDSGEFFFSPADLTVKKGETVTLVVANSGSIVHNISIDEFGVDEDYAAGRTAVVTFTPNQTGTFRMYCDEPGHTEAGMVGTLIVED